MNWTALLLTLSSCLAGCTATEPAPTSPASVVAELRDTGAWGAEPSIGVTSSGSIFVVAGDLTMRSRDGGESWQSVFNFSRELAGRDIYATRDPMLWVDPATDRVFTSHLYLGVRNFIADPPSAISISACTFLAWSDDDGQTWTSRELACITPYVDHPKLASGRMPPGTVPLPGDHPSALYLCYNKFSGRGTGCMVSRDGGQTLAYETPVANDATNSCAGIAGQPTTRRSDGAVVLALGIECAEVTLFRSFDMGVTWQETAGPAGSWGAESIDPEVSFAPDGALLLAWRGRDQTLLLARSEDTGTTWQGPWTIPLRGAVTALETMVAGDGGKVALAFLATNGALPGTSPSEVPASARWNLHLAFTDNVRANPPRFNVLQATTDDDPIQVGPICLGGSGCADARNLLDFFDSTRTPDGQFMVAYTDGCDACSSSQDSRQRHVSVAWLEGWELSSSSPSLHLSPEARMAAQ